MCRMFGVVSARPVVPRELMRDAPRSLRMLSNEHRDGWGVAIRSDDDWIIHRSTACAARCSQYAELVDQIETRLLIAHVRQKTVGETSIVNTHPFRRGSFVFAHNGTLRDVSAITLRCSQARLAEIEGQTDSERLFAFVMTHVDAARDVEAGVVAAVHELHSLGDLGATSFLLSCGERLYAHRLGRTLFTLVRHAPNDENERRTPTIVVASERLTDEPWVEIAERGLVMIGEVASEAVVRPLAA